MPKFFNWPFFKPQTSPLLGIDISASGVKLLEVIKQKTTWQVNSAAWVNLPEATFLDARINNFAALVSGLKEAVSQAKPLTKKVALALPTSQVIIKPLTVNKNLSPQEAEEQLLIEASQSLPYPLAEVALDFKFLPPEHPTSPNQPVLLVASRKELVEQLDEVVLAAGLQPSVVEVEGFALARAAQLAMPAAPSSLLGLINLEAAKASLHLISGQEVFASRDLTTASPDQLIRQLEAFFATSSHPPLAGFLVAGSAANTDFLAALNAAFNLPASLANPLAAISLAKGLNPAALKPPASAWLLACGLALRGN